MESIGVLEKEERVKQTMVDHDLHMDRLYELSVAKEMSLRNLDIDIYEYISRHLVPERPGVRVMDTNDSREIGLSVINGYTSLVNLCSINKVRYINKFLINVNKSLPDAGIYIGNIETTDTRKEKLYKNSKNILQKLYWLYCFVFHRVFPKIKFLQKLYFLLTKGKDRWLTQAEMLGRLVSCGFDIIEFSKIRGVLFFVVMKTGKPDMKNSPSYGPVFPMKRVGKGGKLIKVYKFRTMHPYSEYLQKFVIQLYGYNEFGKPAHDFRLTHFGKFLRKYWLDELPQLINVFKGELGLVGVRPLSLTRFKELPKDVQELRIKFKPGCIPPYVALNMPDDEGNIIAERIYMRERLKDGFVVDIKYFFMAMYNIFTGKIRSS